MKNQKLKRGIQGFIIVSILLWIIWGNITVDITKVTILNEKIPEQFSGYKIIQLSDLHNAEFGKNNENLVKHIAQLKPDMIVFTGDIVDSNKTNVDVALNLVGKLVNIAPCYYVTGNHESLIGNEYKRLEDELKELGVIVLRDEAVILEKEGEQIQIIGLDDPCFSGNIVSYKMKNMERTDNYTIMLSHRPELFEMYVETGVDLVFAGHAHGGQVRIPFIGGVIAPDQGLLPKYDAGVYQEKNTTMIVSRGIGNSIVPIRINNRPEIIVAELKREE